MKFLVLLGLALAVSAGIALSRALLRRARIVIPPGHVGLLYRDGRLVRELAPGGYFGGALLAQVRIHNVPLFPRAEGPMVVEVMSADRFAFRLHVALIVRIVEPRIWAEQQPVGPEGFVLYGSGFPMLQSGLSALVAAKVAACKLEDLLGTPALAVEGLAGALAPYLPGAEANEIIVTALILPPEIRKMLSEVERARIEGQAALERARAEQAAMRALANAARLLDNNPNLARLRMLQVMESAKGQKNFVLGNLAPSAAGEIIVTGEE
jgi:regulator of protease activity HflC (stomatin/prohibitin superfamily)